MPTPERPGSGPRQRDWEVGNGGGGANRNWAKGENETMEAERLGSGALERLGSGALERFGSGALERLGSGALERL
jgi:hypothetical protein